MRRDCIRGFLGFAGILPTSPCRAMLVLSLSLAGGCADTVYVYKMYGGPERPASEIAIVDMGEAVAARVGQRNVDRSDYGQLSLLPGSYPIRWACVYGVSMLIEPSGWAAGEGAGEVLLQAGHRYSMHCDRTTGPGYETFQWLKDDTTGQVVAGVRKP